MKQKDVKNPAYVNQLKSARDIPEKLKGKPDETLFFELSFDQGPVMNNIVYEQADRPLLHQLDEVDEKAICNSPNFTVATEVSFLEN